MSQQKQELARDNRCSQKQEQHPDAEGSRRSMEHPEEHPEAGGSRRQDKQAARGATGASENGILIL